MSEIRSSKRHVDPRMIVAVLAGLYGLSPIDGIPDFLPVIGQLDDVGVIVIALIAVLFLSLVGEQE